MLKWVKKKLWDGEFIHPTEEEREFYPGHVVHPWARRAWKRLMKFWLVNWPHLIATGAALAGLAQFIG